jgi:hypothetical protein
MVWIRSFVVAAALVAPQAGHAAVLDAFVGKYPHEPVGGRTILELPAVRDSMNKLLGAQLAKLVRSFTVASPIEALQDPQLGRLVLVWQCRAHDCPNQAALLLRPDGEAVAACLARDEAGRTTTEWIGQGWRTITQDPDCAGGGEALTRLNAARARAQGGR